MNVSPKGHLAYCLATRLGKAECHIYCQPRQKWDVVLDSGNSVILSRKNVILVIPKDDFEKHWKEV